MTRRTLKAVLRSKGALAPSLRVCSAAKGRVALEAAEQASDPTAGDNDHARLTREKDSASKSEPDRDARKARACGVGARNRVRCVKGRGRDTTAKRAAFRRTS